MPTITVTEARSSLYQLLDNVAASHEPVLITGIRGNAVLIAEEDWCAINETLYYTRQAEKDAKELTAAGLRDGAQELLKILAANPYQNPPPYEKLVGDLAGTYSRRINIHHLLVYQVHDDERVVKVIRMWTHYE